MRAARLVGFGDPPTFAMVDVSAPVPGPGDVVVEVRAAAMNRRDPWVWKTPGYCALPVTLGSDAAGVVSDVGAEVDGVAVGDEVVINPTFGWPAGADVPWARVRHPRRAARRDVRRTGLRPRRERRAATATPRLARVRGAEPRRPDGVACDGLLRPRRPRPYGPRDGRRQRRRDLRRPDRRRARGDRVRDDVVRRKRRRLEALGASQVFSYADGDWDAQVRRASGGGVDAVIDSYGSSGWPLGLKALREGGVLVTFGDTGSAEATVEIADVYWHWRSILGTEHGEPRGVPRPARPRRDGDLATGDRQRLPAGSDRRRGRAPRARRRPLRQDRARALRRPCGAPASAEPASAALTRTPR